MADTPPPPVHASGWWSPANRRALGLFVFFFLVIACFWLQKPIRTSRFLTAVGPQNLPWVKLGTALLILPVVMLYSAAAARYRREHIVYLCVAVFIAASVGFWWAFSRASEPTWTHYVYFFYVDVFNSVMVALFWSFANDLSDPAEARRTYGFVGAGGILGGAVGSSLTGISAERLGTANLLLICVGGLVAIAALARWVAASARELGATTAIEEKREPGLRDAVAGARLTFASPYLASIALLVGLYEIVSNVIDYQFNVLVAARYHEEAAMASFLGLFNSAAIVASLCVQFLLTTWILRRWGPRVGLLLLPLALAGGSAGFLLLPSFLTIAACFFSDATLSYSLNQSTKESLYTPTDSAAKYQAKAFIDMFLMRFAKGLSAVMILAWIAWFAPHGWQTHQLGGLSLAVIALWLLVARRAARRYEALVRPNPQPTPSDSSTPLSVPAHRAVA